MSRVRADAAGTSKVSVSVLVTGAPLAGLPDAPPVVLCLVVIPDDPSQMTANLMGPLVMNADKRLGKQVVLHDSSHSPRARLLPDAAEQEEPALV